MISDKIYKIVMANSDVRNTLINLSIHPPLSLIIIIIMKNYLLQRLNSAIIFDRDFGYNYFGFKVILLIY